MKFKYCFFILFLVYSVVACSEGNINEDPPGTEDIDDDKDKDDEDDSYYDYLQDHLVNTQKLNTGIVHQKGHPLEKLHVIQGGSLSAGQKVLIATLQGIISKSSPEQIYIDEGGPSTVWRNYLQSDYGITISTSLSFNSLIDRFIELGVVKGYILYDRTANKRSITVATSLCGPLNAIAVDKSIEKDILAKHSLIKLTDVSDKDEIWLLENQPEAFSKVNIAELSPEINHHLRDYIALTNTFTFYDGISAWRSRILQTLEAGAYCLGYGEDEFNMVAGASAQGISTLPTDLAPNLAPMSSIYDMTGSKQRDRVTGVIIEENVHYVTFLVSDGDNIAYNMWSQQQYFSDQNRGNFAVGYTITPSLYDLAPPVLRWYFENSTENDYFVCGPSGSSYIFPSRMPAEALDTYVEKLDEFISATGLRICNILDQGAFENIELWDKYLSQPHIDALIYTGYGESATGKILFSSNGKPIIAQRDNLWQGLQEEAEVIYKINNRPADPYSQDGYSLVFVHCWTKSISDIKYVTDRLNSNVKVVTPDVFVNLIQTNLNN